MLRPTLLQHVLVGATAALLIASRVVPGNATPSVTPVAADDLAMPAMVASTMPTPASASEADAALATLGANVREVSDPRALADAFHSYYAYRAAHPESVKNAYLYFVDYGLPSSTPRGYVFDMAALTIVDGPFMVAHGRGSSSGSAGVPNRFSNASGSAATSLGLYVAQELYAFVGHTAGQTYRSTGLRLQGVSTGYNDNARARGVVAHGAPYVTASRAGRSEGCPAVDPARAERLLPKLANGGMVFLFAPDAGWLAGDPWVSA